MPRFIGAVVDKEHNQTAFRELYEFSVKAPVEVYGTQAVLRVLVTPEVDESHIAEHLARMFGAEQEGDSIELTLLETDYEGAIVTFRLPVEVAFAAAQRGPEYIQIGLLDLQEYFHCDRYRGVDEFLEITVKPESDRVCSDEEEPDLSLDGVSAES